MFTEQDFLIGEDFNAKHCIWNNLSRNAIGSAIKNYSEFIKYPRLSDYTQSNLYIQTTWLHINQHIFDIFLSSVFHLYNY